MDFQNSGMSKYTRRGIKSTVENPTSTRGGGGGGGGEGGSSGWPHAEWGQTTCRGFHCRFYSSICVLSTYPNLEVHKYTQEKLWIIEQCIEPKWGPPLWPYNYRSWGGGGAKVYILKSGGGGAVVPSALLVCMSKQANKKFRLQTRRRHTWSHALTMGHNFQMKGDIIGGVGAATLNWDLRYYWGLQNLCTKKQNPKSVKRSLFGISSGL